MPGKVKNSPLTIIGALVVILIIALGLYGWWHWQSARSSSNKQNAINYISVEQLAQKILDGDSVLIFDLRPRADFVASHIPAAISLPYYDIADQSEKLALLDNAQAILVCANQDCPELKDALRDFDLAGFKDVQVLEGGFTAYKAADLGLASEAQIVQEDLVGLLKSIKVPELTIDDYLKIEDDPNLLLIDTRTSYEFIAGFMPHAINIPLYTMGAALSGGLIDKTKTVVVYDRVGNRSPIAAQALIQAGIKNVYDLSGGIEAWKNQGGELNIPNGDGSNLKELIPVLDPQQ